MKRVSFVFLVVCVVMSVIACQNNTTNNVQWVRGQEVHLNFDNGVKLVLGQDTDGEVVIVMMTNSVSVGSMSLNKDLVKVVRENYSNQYRRVLFDENGQGLPDKELVMENGQAIRKYDIEYKRHLYVHEGGRWEKVGPSGTEMDEDGHVESDFQRSIHK